MDPSLESGALEWFVTQETHSWTTAVFKTYVSTRGNNNFVKLKRAKPAVKA